MFDLRTEAEMRLHSDETAKELALKKQKEDDARKRAEADAESAATEAQSPPE